MRHLGDAIGQRGVNEQLAGYSDAARASMTTDHYYGRAVRATGAAALLEAIDRKPNDEKG